MSEVRESNTVFADNKHEDRSAMPGPIPQKSKDDFGFDIPIESIPLPSLGKVYPSSSALCNRESVEIRAMTAKDEDILMSRAYIKNGTVISKLLESCIVDKDVKVTEMLSGDRNALMIGLRTIGYGADYRVEVECPECEHRNTAEFDLTNVPIKPLDIEPVDSGENVFEFTLPVTKHKIEFKFLAGGDEEEISKTQERKKKKGFVAESVVTTRLLYNIVSVNGDSNRTKIAQYTRNMLARDSLALRKYVDKHEPGVELSDYMTCAACGEESKVNIPLGASFFWPDTE
jgi:hypothetical protein